MYRSLERLWCQRRFCVGVSIGRKVLFIVPSRGTLGGSYVHRLGAWGFLDLGFRGLGFRGLGCRGLGFRGLGFRGLGFRCLGAGSGSWSGVRLRLKSCSSHSPSRVW